MPASGSVAAIYVGETHAAPLSSVPSVEARAGYGLVGDRTYVSGGPSDSKHSLDHELTLIEFEAVEALRVEEGIVLNPADARRNLLTRGVALNHLVGREFRVGMVRARGLRLCEPCSHLAKLTSPEVRKGLVHRGGLRAQILTDGMIRVGDPVVVDPEPVTGGSS